jgi:hypothetical protein
MFTAQLERYSNKRVSDLSADFFENSNRKSVQLDYEIEYHARDIHAFVCYGAGYSSKSLPNVTKACVDSAFTHWRPQGQLTTTYGHLSPQI